MELVNMNISKGEEKRRCLSLEIRAKMYEVVHELRKEGLGYRKIQRKIYEKYGARISRSLIHYWINRKHNPLGKVNKFDNRSSPELAYVIGTVFSDGYKYFDGKDYLIGLAVKDYEFAEEFGRCLAKVLRRKPYKPFWNERKKRWIVHGYGILLFNFLSKSFEELKPYIEHSKDTISAFLKALFDGEGSMHKSQRKLTLYNTNMKLLNYVKYLLKQYFDINSTGPHLKMKSGKTIHLPSGRAGKAKKDYYYLYIRVESLQNFYTYIGFIIERKQKRLIRAIDFSPIFFSSLFKLITSSY